MVSGSHWCIPISSIFLGHLNRFAHQCLQLPGCGVSGDWFFHSMFAQIWRGIQPSMISQFSEMVVVLEGSYGICLYLHVRCGIADNSCLLSQDAWFSFPLLLRMIDWWSVEVLIDPVLDPFTCLRHIFLKCPISPQLKQCSLAAGQFFRSLSPSGWDISLHPLHVLSLEILGVPSSWDCFCLDLTEPNVVGRIRLFQRWGGYFICGFQTNQPVEFLL